MAKFCTKCGKPIENCTCNQSAAAKVRPTLTVIKDYLSIGDSDVRIEKDKLEYGQKIVPDITDLCDGEVPIKQYEIGRSLSRGAFSLGYSRVQVTNKRVIQRTVGYSGVGKDIDYSENAIDDIVGVDFTKGKQAYFSNFFLLLLCSLFMAFFGSLLGSIGWFPTAIFIIGFLGFFFYGQLVKKKVNNFLCAILSSLVIGSIYGNIPNAESMDAIQTSLSILILFVLITLIFLIRFSILPNVTLVLKTKSMPGTGVFMASSKMMLSGMGRRKLVLPSKDTEIAMKELGAMITDIQKLGDFAIEKWKR